MKALKQMAPPPLRSVPQAVLPPVGTTKELQCDNCGHVGPMDDFHSRYKCHKCHKAKDLPVIETLSGERIVRDQEVVKALSTAILGKKVKAKNSHSISDISDALLDEFGGAAAFARSWYYIIQEAKLRDPGGYSVMRAHEQISKLVLDVNKMEGEQEIAQAMDDAKLETEIVQILIDKIREGNVDIEAIINGQKMIEKEDVAEEKPKRRTKKKKPAKELVTETVPVTTETEADLSQLSDDELLAMEDVIKEATED